jgi:uncharacterized protein (DUF1501 family)
MKRRNFLHTAAAGTAATLPFFLNGMPLQTMAKSALFSAVNPDSDKVLVLIQLIGGNDGLNTIIPLDQYAGLAAVRGNIIIPEQFVQPLTDTVGVHPGLSFLRAQYDEGKAGVIQSVGYPNQNRSHFRSMDIWNTGSGAENTWSTGWLGRYLDSYFEDYPEGYPNADYPHPFAITMGYNVSETCQGWAANYSLTVFDPFSLNPLLEGAEGTLPDTPYGDELAFLRHSIVQTNAYGEVITEAANLGANTVNYPESGRLAQQLKNVALLISGGLRTKVFVVSIGGFDTHANQVLEGSTLGGEHAQLMKTVSEAMTSFQIDLVNLGIEERVLSMTFSEFGRRIRSNASFGTDHGTAAPIMLFGSCVNPQVLGENPEIDNQIGNAEGVPMQYDFRDVYGSILRDWFEVEDSQVRSLLYEDFTYLPILSDCNEVEEEEEEELLTSGEWLLEASPNPCREGFILSFQCQRTEVRIALFDAVGKVVKQIAARTLPQGRHRIQVDMSTRSPGVYVVRLQMGQQVQTKRVVKVE